MVKLFFKDRTGGQEGSRHLPLVNHKDATFVINGKGLLKASKGEAEANPRSRSAKLRWANATKRQQVRLICQFLDFPILCHSMPCNQGEIESRCDLHLYSEVLIS